MAKYVTPTIEITEKPSDGKGSFFVRLAYGYVGARMDTSKMTTDEVIREFLNMKGAKSPNEFFKKKFKGESKETPKQQQKPSAEKEQPKVEPLKREDFKSAKQKMVDSDGRIHYGRIITKKKLQQNLELGQNGVGELTTHLFNEDAFGLGNSTSDGAYFSRVSNVAAFKMDSFVNNDSNIHEKGGTFYHECWHAIDNNFGDNVIFDRYGIPESGGYMSLDYRLSTGKTFQSTLLEEYKSVDVAEIKKIIEDEINNYPKAKYGKTKGEIVNWYNEQLAIAEDLYNKKGYSEYLAYRNTEEFQKAAKAYIDTRSTPATVKRKWADMSDVVDGATRGRDNLVGVGHRSSYWDADTRAKECFAEIASSKATNPASYEVFKKYLPETVKAFEEIYNGLESGKIKSKGRPKYEK